MEKNTDKKNKVVIFLSGDGYKLSSWYGKILMKGVSFSELNGAKKACDAAGFDYIVA